jgi:hypothetical protein
VFWETNSSDNSRKRGCQSVHDPGRSKNYPLKRKQRPWRYPEKELGCIIHDNLDMRKLSAKGIPERLSDDEKLDRVLASQAILDRFRRDPVGFMNRLITMDEARINNICP